MNLAFDAPILGWRTLKDVYLHYLARTPSEEGTRAAEVISRAEKRASLTRVVAEVGASHGRLAPEAHGEMLASVEEDIEQAKRMRALVAHIMARDAAEGLWFAIGRADGIGRHQFIHPSHWKFLLMNIEKGAVGRDRLRFEDLRCAFTRDVPAGHPIHAAMRIALKESPHFVSPETSSIALKEVESPTTAPPPTSHTSRHDGPGRPSIFHLVDEEFERRVKNNTLEPSLSKQAEALSAWFKNTHPRVQPYQPKTIANRLRSRYKAAAVRLKNGPKK
jgi:hypothetical protein